MNRDQKWPSKKKSDEPTPTKYPAGSSGFRSSWLEMKEDQQRFLNLLGQLPARLTVKQTAWVSNCQPHDVPVLVVARLLKPLGNPQPDIVKYFATQEILELTKDRTWLAKVTNAVSQHWKRKNQPKAAPTAMIIENSQSLGCVPTVYS